MIEKNYFRRVRFDLLTLFVYLIVGLVLVITGYYGFALIPAIFFLPFLVVLWRGYRYHRDFIRWMEENPDARIFIYSNKKKYLPLIEQELLPVLKGKSLIVRNNDSHISGDLKPVTYFELHHAIGVRRLPLLVEFRGNKYTKIRVKESIDKYLRKEIGKEDLLKGVV